MLERIQLFGYANFSMRAEKIKVCKLEAPEEAKNCKVFTTEVTPEPLLGIGDSKCGLSPRTVKFNQKLITKTK